MNLGKTGAVSLGLAIALVAAACTPTNTQTSTTNGGSTTSAPPPPTSATSSSTTFPVRDDGSLLPRERDRTSSTASDALVGVSGFQEDTEPSQLAQDLEIAMQEWLIPEFTNATTAAVYTRVVTESSVSVVSVIPTMQWRGDPDFVEGLIEAVSGSVPFNIGGNDIFRTVAASGAHIFLWSTGDGFLMASAINDDDAVQYLEQRRSVATVNEAWSTGACLFLEDDEGLPYAPFPADIVVPCESPHNAEVLLGQTIGTDLVAYDAETIAYDRNFICDEAYQATFGSQRTNAPSLITYMPDEAEWDRGDRYLACIVTIERNVGRELVSGPMVENADLSWSPSPGECLGLGLPAETTSCSGPHAYQYLGDAEVVADTWPTFGSAAFTAACAPLVDDLPTGPADIEVLPFGLGAFGFEQGERTVRCMAFATTEGFLVEVKGSFAEEWTVVLDNGVAA